MKMEVTSEDVRVLQDEARLFYTEITRLALEYEQFSRQRRSFIRALRTGSAVRRLSLLPVYLEPILADGSEIHIRDNGRYVEGVRNVSQIRLYAKLLEKHAVFNECNFVDILRQFLTIWRKFGELRTYVASRMWLCKHSRLSNHTEVTRSLVRDINRTLSAWEQLQHNEHDFLELYRDPTVSVFQFGKDFHYTLKHDELPLFGGVVLVIPKAIHLAFSVHDLIKDYCSATLKRTDSYIFRKKISDTLAKNQAKNNKDFARVAKLRGLKASDEIIFGVHSPVKGMRSLAPKSSLSSSAPDLSFPGESQTRTMPPKNTRANLYGGGTGNNYPGDPMAALRRMGAAFDKSSRRFYASRR